MLPLSYMNQEEYLLIRQIGIRKSLPGFAVAIRKSVLSKVQQIRDVGGDSDRRYGHGYRRSESPPTRTFDSTDSEITTDLLVVGALGVMLLLLPWREKVGMRGFQ